ncbi:hypothetical protein G6F61_015247 [Rhizopus arrhizus]|nr:hypothetical protein G6F61_015247 [Rhizopus arrhizus]
MALHVGAAARAARVPFGAARCQRGDLRLGGGTGVGQRAVGGSRQGRRGVVHRRLGAVRPARRQAALARLGARLR